MPLVRNIHFDLIANDDLIHFRTFVDMALDELEDTINDQVTT